MWCRAAVVLLCSLSASACSNAVSGDRGETAARTSDLLTRAEIQDARDRDAGLTNVYQVVSRLRPMYLNRVRDIAAVRPGQSSVTIYFDDSQLGTVDNLATIPIDMVKSVRFLSASEATMRWGPRQPGAVILLSARY